MRAAPHATQDLRAPDPRALARVAVALAFILALLALWALMHHHQGFARDGELYALQAYSRLNPALATDVYLAAGSQDRFTVFSPLYAACMQVLGLQSAELWLFIVCTAGFLAAAWAVARALWGYATAWLACALLVSITCIYGAYGIFHYLENYLTARSLGEAMVIAALALHLHGWRRSAIALAVAGLAIHPLMVMPGLLLLLCLTLGLRHALLGAALGVAAMLLIAGSALVLHPHSGPFALIDGAWLEVVRERSQFLFLDTWKWSDWENQLRQFMTLAIAAAALGEPRVRALACAAALVGAVGLLIAYLSGALGPVAIFLQGQSWRWTWVSGFLSVLMLAPAALRLWQDSRGGALCAVLLITAWTFAPMPALPALAVALALWLLRTRIEARAARLLHYAAYAVLAIVLAWTVANAWTLLSSPRAETSAEPLWADRLRSILNLQISALLIFGAAWYWLRSVRTPWPAIIASAALLALLPVILPTALTRDDRIGSARLMAEFGDWRSVIPPANTVLIVPPRKSATFIWFTLERPSYSSVDQSSGVVFSRATALEILRRSHVLLPVTDPDWQIKTQIDREARGAKDEERTRPLTAARLFAICQDPGLNFVIAKETLPFAPLRHTHPGEMKDWNLYDCRRVRTAGPAA